MNNCDIKTYILSTKKKIDDIKKNDLTAIGYIKQLDDQVKLIQELFAQLNGLDKNYENIDERTEMFNLINENLEDINKLNKITKSEYNDYITAKYVELATFSVKYPGFFEQFLSGTIDLSALDHCLNTFMLYKDGSISEETAKELGFKKFHLKK